MEYTQLDHASLQTRFLRLVRRPRAFPGTLRLELVVASLSNPPSYSTLSYCWGTDSSQINTRINEIQVPLRRNLAEALFHCGLPENELIWVDAVSINQLDVHEKNYQVKLMGQIYSQARRTFVWLGPAHPCTEFAGRLLRQCSRILDIQSTRTWDDSPESSSNHFHYVFHQALKDDRSAPKAARGVEDLLTRSYWERVWIIQEIAKAAEVQLYCGPHRLDLQMLLYASTVLKGSIPPRLTALISTIARFRTQEQIQFGGNSRMTLGEALIVTRHSLATDPRDKIYALLGLTSDGNDLVPTPTYTEPVDDVFRKVALSLTRSRLVTNTIFLSRHSPLAEGLCGDTFGVDWSNLCFLPPWLVSRPVSGEAASYSWRLGPGNNRLCTGGRCIGRIEAVAGAYNREPSRGDNEREGHQAIRSMDCLTSSILSRLAPQVSTAAVRKSELREALARMIRDARNGTSAYSEYYDLNRLRTTLEALGSLLMGKYEIHYWAREYNWYRQSVQGKKSYNTLAFRLLEDAIDGLDGPPEARLRFALVSGNIAIVHPDAQEKDCIYQIDQCQLPVILRENRYREKTLVGEACIQKYSNGTWLSGRRLVHSVGLSSRDPEYVEIRLVSQKPAH